MLFVLISQLLEVFQRDIPLSLIVYLVKYLFDVLFLVGLIGLGVHDVEKFFEINFSASVLVVIGKQLERVLLIYVVFAVLLDGTSYILGR